jgi:SAM-dependent methyltransferase
VNADLFELHAAVEESHWWFVGRRRIMRDVLHRIAPPSGRPRVVDVGCGTGANLAALAGEYDCVGIDTSQTGIELARRRFPGVRYVHGYAPEDLGPGLDGADVVLLMDVMEHVPDDFLFFSRLFAAARPGTHFVVTVPALPALWSRHDELFGHYRRYTPQRLARVWRDLPARVRLLSHFNTRLYPVVRSVRALSRLRGRGAGHGGTDLSIPPAPLNRALQGVFAGEARRLLGRLDAPGTDAGRAGVSLMAVVRREAGAVVPAPYPADVAPNFYDPASAGTPAREEAA